jgi:2-alkenal reductase
MPYRSVRKIAIGSLLLGLTAIHSSLSAASDACVIGSSACLAAIERSIVELFEKASPSVVQIAALTGIKDPSKFAISLGAGFVWDSAGHIVTNEHVVRGAETISIWLVAGERLEAEVVGLAPNYDLAVLRLKQAQAMTARSSREVTY